MVLSLEEVDERRVAAKEAYAENGVLKQWYYCLGQAIRHQAEEGADRPVFGSYLHYINGYDPEFITSVIGDQLAELGVELATGYLNAGYESAVRQYILYPEERHLIGG